MIQTELEKRFAVFRFAPGVPHQPGWVGQAERDTCARERPLLRGRHNEDSEYHEGATRFVLSASSALSRRPESPPCASRRNASSPLHRLQAPFAECGHRWRL